MEQREKPARKGRVRVIILLLIDILLLIWILHARSEAKDEELRRKYTGYGTSASAVTVDPSRC